MWWLLLSAVHADCPNLNGLLVEAETASREARDADAEAALSSAESAMECQWVGPDQVTRFWLAEGVTAWLSGDPTAMSSSFRAARRTQPEFFDDAYGSKLRALWESTEASTDTGTLALAPEPVRFEARLDGGPWRAEAAAGLHLIQVGPPEAPEYTGMLLVAGGVTSRIDTGAVELEPIVEPEPIAPEPEPVRKPREKKQKKSPALLIASGSALALGAGGLLLAANEQGRAIPNAETAELAKAARTRQLLFGYSGYGLVGLGAVGVGLHFAL